MWAVPCERFPEKVRSKSGNPRGILRRDEEAPLKKGFSSFASMEDKKGGKGKIVSELKLAAAPTDTYEKVFKLLSAIKGVPDVEGKPVFLLVTILL